MFCQRYTGQSKKHIQIDVKFWEITFTEYWINHIFVVSEEKLNCKDCFGALIDTVCVNMYIDFSKHKHNGTELWDYI